MRDIVQDLELPGCPRVLDLPAWLLGQSTAEEASSLQSHVAACSVCQAEARELRPVLYALGEAPLLPPHPDLAASILASLPQDAFRSERRGQRLTASLSGMAAAAALLVCLTLAQPAGELGVRAVQDQPQERLSLAAEASWLLAQQGPDGSFQEPTGATGKARGLDLTALALGTLSGLRDQATPTLLAMDGAFRALCRRQSPAGRMGAPGPQGVLQHAVATWALARLQVLRPWPEVARRLREATTHLVALQQTDGAFGTATAWALKALQAARTSGCNHLDPPIRATRLWLEAQAHQAPEPRGDQPGPRRLQATCRHLLARQQMHIPAVIDS